MMLRLLLLFIVIAIGIALLGLMAVGWWRRRRRQRDVAPLVAPPSLPPGAAEHAGTYVATTAAGDPYDRIIVGGLGFRGRAVATVHPSGVLVRRTGEVALWIPRVDLIDAGRATWTIDRVVEPDGLTMVRWGLGDRAVDTYLRLDDPRAFDGAVAAILPPSQTITSPTQTPAKDPA